MADKEDREEQTESLPPGLHSLDSDEEDVKKPERRLQEDDIEGEEDATITREGDIAITPFNLKEEMSSGYFDASGFFVQNTESGEIHDSWLDQLDDGKVDDKASEAHRIRLEKIQQAEEESDSDDDFDIEASRRILLGYLKPRESVTGAIKRLAAASKSKTASKDEIEDSKYESNKLMEIVNAFVTNSMYDIYQETHESLTTKLAKPSKLSEPTADQEEEPTRPKKVKLDLTPCTDGVDDMFA